MVIVSYENLLQYKILLKSVPCSLIWNQLTLMIAFRLRSLHLSLVCDSISGMTNGIHIILGCELEKCGVHTCLR